MKTLKSAMTDSTESRANQLGKTTKQPVKRLKKTVTAKAEQESITTKVQHLETVKMEVR